MRFAALHVGSMKVFVFLAFRFETFLISCRGVQHLWHTARNEAIARGGKGSRTLDPVPAKSWAAEPARLEKSFPRKAVSCFQVSQPAHALMLQCIRVSMVMRAYALDNHAN